MDFPPPAYALAAGDWLSLRTCARRCRGSGKVIMFVTTQPLDGRMTWVFGTKTRGLADQYRLHGGSGRPTVQASGGRTESDGRIPSAALRRERHGASADFQSRPADRIDQTAGPSRQDRLSQLPVGRTGGFTPNIAQAAAAWNGCIAVFFCATTSFAVGEPFTARASASLVAR